MNFLWGLYVYDNSGAWVSMLRCFVLSVDSLSLLLLQQVPIRLTLSLWDLQDRHRLLGTDTALPAVSVFL